MRQNVYDYAFELKRDRQRRDTKIFMVLLCVIVVLSLFLTFLLYPVRVKSDSMESEVKQGGVLFVTPIIRTPKRGDVMILSRADGVKHTGFNMLLDDLIRFFTAQQIDLHYSGRFTSRNCIRRVLALPGDSVYMKDYVLYVKPAGESHFLTEFELADKPYSVHIYSVPSGWDGLGSVGTMDAVTLGRDEYFVLADNRIEAADSRLWGAVKASRICGKVLIQYFPFTKMRVY